MTSPVSESLPLIQTKLHLPVLPVDLVPRPSLTEWGGDLRSQLDQIPDVEIVGIAPSQRATLNQVEATQPDFLLIDLILPRWRASVRCRFCEHVSLG
jgi:hypothetical protein